MAQDNQNQGHGHKHPEHWPELESDSDIVVSAHPPTDYAMLSATTTISSDEIVQASKGQLGDLLTSLPGVSSTSFAPGASRPLLRGFSGDRVAILIDGIGSSDASTVSADHAVVFDPLSVHHIDVFHGPAVLLFGGNAIGGAVNGLDKRIPRFVPKAINGTVSSGFSSGANEKSAGGYLEIPLSDRWAARFDGNWRKSDDLNTGGLIASAHLREHLLEEADELFEEGAIEEGQELEELASISGRIPNSAAESFTLGAGLAFIDERGDFGFSVQRFESKYGVPLRPGAGHHHEEEEHHDDDDGDGDEDEHHEEDEHDSIAIDLVQTRFDVRGGLNFDGFIESLQLRGSYAKYEHVELENGETGTLFAGKGLEARTDIIQSDSDGWRGRSGLHFTDRNLEIDGVEAFTPDYSVQRFGIFTLQSLGLGGGFTAEAAARYETVRVKARPINFSRQFNLWSGALGLSWSDGDNWSLGINAIHGARTPSPEELLSDGLHIATQSYEIGNPDFRKEESDGVEAYIRYSSDKASFSFTAFATEFDAYISAVPMGDEQEGFPIFRYMQSPARYYGFEASGRYNAFRWDNGELNLNASADYTHARLEGIGPVPLIPPLRLRGELEVRQGDLTFDTEIEWNNRQSRVAPGAATVPGFTLVNAGITWRPGGENGPLSLSLAAENILDTVSRRASSITRDFVPLSGRDIRISARYNF